MSYARRLGGAEYHIANATCLPFADNSFDLALSVTALCFIRHARAEMARVARRRLVIGLLHRHSPLYLQKGLEGGKSGYAGAHWHTAGEVKRLIAGLPVAHPRIRYALLLPSGGYPAKWLEPGPERLPLGAFMALSLDRIRRPNWIVVLTAPSMQSIL